VATSQLVSKDSWILNSGGTNYGNGSNNKITIGATPSAGGGTTYKARYLGKLNAARVNTCLSPYSSISSCVMRFVVASESCATRGGTYRFFLEELLGDFQLITASSDCAIVASTSYPDKVWPGPTATTSRRGSYSGTGLATNSTFDVDITSWAQARLAAGDFSDFVFRLIAANSGLTGYDELNSARTLTVFSMRSSGNEPQMIVNGTLATAGTNATALPATGSGAAYTAAQLSNLTVDGEFGNMIFLSPSQARWLKLGSVSQVGVKVTTTFAIDKLPTGGFVYERLTARHTDKSNHYELTLVIGPDGKVIANITKIAAGVTTLLASNPDIGTLVAPGQFYYANFMAQGATPTALYGKMWAKGTPEPDWQVNASDSTVALQAAAAVGVGGFVGTLSNLPLTIIHDDFTAIAA
jgi:hypothetical protein